MGLPWSEWNSRGCAGTSLDEAPAGEHRGIPAPQTEPPQEQPPAARAMQAGEGDQGECCAPARPPPPLPHPTPPLTAPRLRSEGTSSRARTPGRRGGLYPRAMRTARGRRAHPLHPALTRYTLRADGVLRGRLTRTSTRSSRSASMKLAVAAALASYPPPHRHPPSNRAPLHRPSPILPCARLVLRSFPSVCTADKQTTLGRGATFEETAPLRACVCIIAGGPSSVCPLLFYLCALNLAFVPQMFAFDT